MEIRPNPKLKIFIIRVPLLILATLTILSFLQEGAIAAITCAILVLIPIAIYIPLALYDLNHTYYSIEEDKIVIKRKSLFKKTEQEMPYKKIENVEFHTNVVLDYINSGSIIISGTGGASLGLANVENPAIVRKKIMDIVLKYNETNKDHD